MKKALFLDRDGVINVDNGYVYKIQDFVFIEGIFDFLLHFQAEGYLLIIVSNQAGIARGYYTVRDYEVLNAWLLDEFSKRGIHIAKTYYCPYHPIVGHGEYLKDSPDRKPNPGMILKARDEFTLDLEASVLIGDKNSDMEAGRRAGVGRLIFLRGKYPTDSAADVEIFDCLHI